MKSLSCVGLFATPWTVAHQARVLERVASAFSTVHLKLTQLSDYTGDRPWGGAAPVTADTDVPLAQWALPTDTRPLVAVGIWSHPWGPSPSAQHPREFLIGLSSVGGRRDPHPATSNVR